MCKYVNKYWGHESDCIFFVDSKGLYLATNLLQAKLIVPIIYYQHTYAPRGVSEFLEEMLHTYDGGDVSNGRRGK